MGESPPLRCERPQCSGSAPLGAAMNAPLLLFARRVVTAIIVEYEIIKPIMALEKRGGLHNLQS